jgi:hypothetical protein
MALERIVIGLVGVGGVAVSAAAGLGYMLPAVLYCAICTAVTLITLQRENAILYRRHARMVELAQYITSLRQEIVERRVATSEETPMVEILDHSKLEGVRRDD